MISVITWDAGFRESFHTVDFFDKQTLSKKYFEFIWVDYYSTINTDLQLRINKMGNGKAICCGGMGKWHLGKCINSAVKKCEGDLIIIPDGDVVVDDSFLDTVIDCHNQHDNLVLYFRRMDEPEKKDVNNHNISLRRLRESCRLNNPLNYGGCISLSKKTFIDVEGYEEHDLFSQAGANGKELYVRLKNAGFPIMWHPSHKIYHPWHRGSGPKDPDYQRKIMLQNYVIQQRDLSIATKADKLAVDSIIEDFHKNRSSLSIFERVKSSIFNYIF